MERKCIFFDRTKTDNDDAKKKVSDKTDLMSQQSWISSVIQGY